MSAVFVDLTALAENLQQVPLHQRLNLEAELVQVGDLTAFLVGGTNVQVISFWGFKCSSCFRCPRR